ncbi:hypothetical protein RhiLY_03314 [Ceratobasidium sp. AG-Ba]|nr:hypothetical protein RhiLY_03314 [Ceratobasidium sp. AG-Ba]
MEHLLALKVMRLSRPSLASHPQPYFADSNALTAHAQASPLSLEQSSHCRAVRLRRSEILLCRETFTSCLCVNNESALEIIGTHLLVEIQTASTKIPLGQAGGIDNHLQPGEMLQLVVNHEIKELGQHVLACTVSYHVPPALRNSAIPPEDPANPTLRTIRKFYKFMVSNPLTVRTKVHVPRSPTALLNPRERHKVFLEVHVQNLTTKPLHFERIKFECAEGWQLENNPTAQSTSSDRRKSITSDSKNEESGVHDSLALLHPQDLRQYMYILLPTPEATPSFPIPYPPGTIIALGRLDMSWRSSFGEPGRLLTSMLSRKIPLPPAPQAASAIPPHLQQQAQRRPGSPAPYNKNRASVPVPGRPQSPALASHRPMSPSLSGSFSSTATGPIVAPVGGVGVAGREKEKDIEVDLVVHQIPGTVYLDQPFKVKCAVGVQASLPPTPLPSSPFATSDPATAEPALLETPKPPRRLIRLAIQHTHPTPPAPAAPPAPMAPEVSSPRALLSALSSPGGGATPRIGPQLDLGAVLQGEPIASATIPGFPTPYSSTAPTGSPAFLGASLHILPPIILSEPATYPEIGPLASIAKNRPGPARGEGWSEFDLKFVPLGAGGGGMKRIGGLRVLVIEDRELRGDDQGAGEEDAKGGSVVKEWDVIGEVWAERSESVLA